MADIEQGDGDHAVSPGNHEAEAAGKGEFHEEHSEPETHNGGPGHHMDQMEDGYGGGPDFGGPMRGGFWRGP